MNYKVDFPLLNNRDIAYLDSGATTQKPIQVINRVEEFYKNYVCMIDGEIVNGEERIPFLQELYSTMHESDDQFLEISENILSPSCPNGL